MWGILLNSVLLNYCISPNSTRPFNQIGSCILKVYWKVIEHIIFTCTLIINSTLMHQCVEYKFNSLHLTCKFMCKVET